MGVTKANVVIANNTTMTAGAGDVTNGANTDLTGAYRTIANIRFTNGATPPTVAPRVDVQICEANAGSYSTLVTVNGDTSTANSVSYRLVELPDPVEFCQFISGSNTGQAVTLRIVIEKITGI